MVELDPKYPDRFCMFGLSSPRDKVWRKKRLTVSSSQVEESPNTGKISLGLSVIIRVTLKDGTFHEVRAMLFEGGPFTNIDPLDFIRTSDTVTSKTAKGKLRLLKRPKRRARLMVSNVH